MLMSPVPQPVDGEELERIPRELTGLYREVGADETLYVAPTFFRYGHWKAYVNHTISSDFVLKKTEPGFVLNMRQDSTGPWVIFPLEVRKEDSLLIVYAFPPPENPRQERRLSHIVSKVVMKKVPLGKKRRSLTRQLESQTEGGYTKRWLIVASPEEFKELMEKWPRDTVAVFRRLPQGR